MDRGPDPANGTDTAAVPVALSDWVEEIVVDAFPPDGPGNYPGVSKLRRQLLLRPARPHKALSGTSWRARSRLRSPRHTTHKPGNSPLIHKNKFLYDRVTAARDKLRYIADRWRMNYNHYRPHSSLDYMAPAAFAAMYLEQGSDSLRFTEDRMSNCERRS